MNKLSESFGSHKPQVFKGELILETEDLYTSILPLFLKAFEFGELKEEEWANNLYESMMICDLNNCKQIFELGFNCSGVIFSYGKKSLNLQREDDVRRIKLYQEMSHSYHVRHNQIEIDIKPLVQFLVSFDFKKIGVTEDINFYEVKTIYIRDYANQQEIKIKDIISQREKCKEKFEEFIMAMA